MLINKGTAISTSSILLVPYEASHVPTYHEWMKDEQIQAETASEPLTLSEEYAMQRSWRTDVDKLTFIACLPLSSTSSSPPRSIQTPHQLTPGIADSPSSMIGDVNLFLTPSSSSPSPPSSPSQNHNGTPIFTLITGEIELMIAPLPHRRKGHGRGAILAFLTYISTHLPSILSEYARGQEPPLKEGDVRLEGLRVKIGVGNVGSLALFRSLGFVGKEGKEEPNYFGEVELWFKGELGGDGNGDVVRELRERWGVEGYEELVY
ncbi:GNAT domain-containing protein, partial [Leptodontidium sp. 2 PMI_412]